MNTTEDRHSDLEYVRGSNGVWYITTIIDGEIILLVTDEVE